MNAVLIFDIVLIGISIFINGWTDTPNTIATVIATRVLNPRAAVFLGMAFNLLGIFLLGSAVAATTASIITIGTGTDALVALGAVQISNIAWTLTAWKYGLPTSNTHAAIAGLMGAGISFNGIAAFNMGSLNKVFIGLFISSAAGFLLSFLLAKVIKFSCKNMKRRFANKAFARGQILSASLLAVSNGAQDGQRFMGIIYFALILGGIYPEKPSGSVSMPAWIFLLCACLMVLGISMGGYRIIKRIGMQMVQLDKYQGFAAEAVASGSMLVSTLFGIPLSITSTKGSAMIGAAASKGLNKVNWSIAKELVLAWMLTFPACMLLGYIFATVFRMVLRFFV